MVMNSHILRRLLGFDAAPAIRYRRPVGTYLKMALIEKNQESKVRQFDNKSSIPYISQTDSVKCEIIAEYLIIA